jgi:hypothetical protein
MRVLMPGDRDRAGAVLVSLPRVAWPEVDGRSLGSYETSNLGLASWETRDDLPGELRVSWYMRNFRPRAPRPRPGGADDPAGRMHRVTASLDRAYGS